MCRKIGGSGLHPQIRAFSQESRRQQLLFGLQAALGVRCEMFSGGLRCFPVRNRQLIEATRVNIFPHVALNFLSFKFPSPSCATIQPIRRRPSLRSKTANRTTIGDKYDTLID